MKRSRLETDYLYNFELIGLVSAARGHRLAWEINLMLGTNLTRKPDLAIQINRQDTVRYLHFSSGSKGHKTRLFKNQPQSAKTARPPLIPEYPHSDYILMSEGENRPHHGKLQKDLLPIPLIEMLFFIPLDTLQLKHFFIF